MAKKTKGEEVMTTDLAVTTFNTENYLMQKLEIEDISGIIEDNLGGEVFNIQSLNKIKVPSGGSKTWTLQTSKGEIDVQAINGIVVHNKVVRVYYEKPFGTDGSTSMPPDCFSNDGLTGAGVPGGQCIACPLSKFGSSPDGSRTACPERRLMFVLMEDSMLPSVLSVPPSSLKSARQYLLMLSGEGKRIHNVITEITLVKKKNNNGIEYSEIVFKENGAVTDTRKSATYAKTFKSLVSQHNDSLMAPTVISASEEDIPF